MRFADFYCASKKRNYDVFKPRSKIVIGCFLLVGWGEIQFLLHTIVNIHIET